MAVTAHYISRRPSGDLVMEARLIAFRHIMGQHAGVHLAAEMMKILTAYGITTKVSRARGF